jgi:hypothetical protein
VSCEYTHLDGAYVLGALSPAERLEFEHHLAGCQRCARAVRELAGLPGLLSRVAPETLDEEPLADPVPDTLLPALAREVRRTRRRSSLLAAAAAAAVVALVVVPLGVTGVLDTDDANRPPASAGPTAAAESVRLHPVGGEVPVRATVALEPVPWGTRLDLTCAYDPEWVEYHLPATVTYALVVRTREGRTEQVGTWLSKGGTTMRLTAATAASRQDIASVEVRTLGGRTVLKAPA